jgi:hypothetical protein
MSDEKRVYIVNGQPIFDPPIYTIELMRGDYVIEQVLGEGIIGIAEARAAYGAAVAQYPGRLVIMRHKARILCRSDRAE